MARERTDKLAQNIQGRKIQDQSAFLRSTECHNKSTFGLLGAKEVGGTLTQESFEKNSKEHKRKSILNWKKNSLEKGIKAEKYAREARS